MKEEFGLISIIMAAYNAENTIRQAIESVLRQTYTDWELIVIDDASADKTASIVKEYAASDERIRLFINQKNRGVSYSRKYGLQQTKGNWIAILDSDDLWMEEKLEKQVALQFDTNAELLFTGSSFIKHTGEKLEWIFHVPTTVNYRALLKQNVVSNSSVLVKKELYSQNYAVGDDMHEDFAIWLGITRSGKCAYGLDEPLLIYRLNNSSKSSNIVKAARINWKAYRYMGLNVFSALYYMTWYTIKSLLKYRHLR